MQCPLTSIADLVFDCDVVEIESPDLCEREWLDIIHLAPRARGARDYGVESSSNLTGGEPGGVRPEKAHNPALLARLMQSVSRLSFEVRGPTCPRPGRRRRTR